MCCTCTKKSISEHPTRRRICAQPTSRPTSADGGRAEHESFLMYCTCNILSWRGSSSMTPTCTMESLDSIAYGSFRESIRLHPSVKSPTAAIPIFNASIRCNHKARARPPTAWHLSSISLKIRVISNFQCDSPKSGPCCTGC